VILEYKKMSKYKNR